MKKQEEFRCKCGNIYYLTSNSKTFYCPICKKDSFVHRSQRPRKEWFWKRWFKRSHDKESSVSPKIPSSSTQILSIVCPHCGQKYLIGYDSIVMTNEAAYVGVTKLGATVLSSQNPFQGPDLVMYGGNLGIDVQEENIKRAVQIRADLKRGINRSWRCGKCQDGNSLPILYPG